MSSMKIPTAAALTLAIAAQCNAATTTQAFESSWDVSPWNYYGDVAAMQWHYLPYVPWDSSLGVLQEVRVDTQISGMRQLSSEPIRIRYAFTTGWNPADYQFYREFSLPGGSSSFGLSESYTFNTQSELQNWAEVSYYPPAHYYFESRSVEAPHSISAVTTLTYTYAAAVPEPATWSFLLVGLMAIVGVVGKRNRSNPPFQPTTFGGG